MADLHFSGFLKSAQRSLAVQALVAIGLAALITHFFGFLSGIAVAWGNVIPGIGSYLFARNVFEGPDVDPSSLVKRVYLAEVKKFALIVLAMGIGVKVLPNQFFSMMAGFIVGQIQSIVAATRLRRASMGA